MSDLVARIRDRLHDAPITTERLLDEAADTIDALVKALEWAPKQVGEPRLVRGQNDTHFANYQEARAALVAAKAGTP